MIRKPSVLLAAFCLAVAAALLGMSAQTASAANVFKNFAPLAPTDDTFLSSSITVTGQPNSLQDVDVALNLYFTNQCADDTEVLLQGPTGIRVQLWSDAGGCSTTMGGLLINFDDAAAGSIPDPVVSGIYKPTDVDDNGDPETGVDTEGMEGKSFPIANAATLAAFNGTNPNGTWTLFFGDDAGPDTVGVSGGWSLGLGPDAAICKGQAATIVGTGGDDLIVGTPGNDVISAGTGDDIVKGRGGNDTLCGDAGRDRLKGGAGNKDVCIGGSERDVAKKCEKTKQI